MKQYIKVIAVLLVLLMTASVMVACKGDGGDKDDPIESERETETEREAETEPPLTPEDIAQLKSEMSSSILDALERTEKPTETETQTDQSGNQSPVPDDSNPGYADIVEGLLGSLGGLGNGDYDYSKIISEVLDQYIGSESTSEFLRGLIKSWIENNIHSLIPGIPTPGTSTEEQTKEPTTEPPIAEEPISEQETAPAPSFESTLTALREYVAKKTAEAIADAIVERINEIANGTLYDSIYQSVYDSMTGNNEFLNSLISQSIPDFGFGERDGLTQ